MAAFDAETYLRLAGERELLGRSEPGPWQSPLVERARALVAVGAADADVVERVVDDYACAWELRGRGHGYRRRAHRPTATPQPLGPRRVVRCEQALAQPWGELRLHYAVLDAARVRLAATLTAPVPAAAPTRGRGPTTMPPAGPFGHGGPPSVTITDDRGTSEVAHFSGGGGDTEWNGTFTTGGPLAVDTGWLDVQGEHVRLAEPPAAATVAIEPAQPADPAHRYLQRCLEYPLRRHYPPSSPVDTAIEALVAAGALATDDPVLDEVRAVEAMIDPSPGRGPRFGRNPQPAPSRSLPEPWRSLLAARGRTGGPEGSVVIGAVTPEFDGVSAALNALTSTGDGFELTFEVVGAVLSGTLADEPGRAVMTFTAGDDRGGHYLGHLNGWSGGENTMEGTVAFWPALDPRATRLDISLNAREHRAVIGVALRWDGEA